MGGVQLYDLPDEMLLHVLRFVPATTLATCRQVSTRLCALATHTLQQRAADAYGQPLLPLGRTILLPRRLDPGVRYLYWGMTLRCMQRRVHRSIEAGVRSFAVTPEWLHLFGEESLGPIIGSQPRGLVFERGNRPGCGCEHMSSLCEQLMGFPRECFARLRLLRLESSCALEGGPYARALLQALGAHTGLGARGIEWSGPLEYRPECQSFAPGMPVSPSPEVGIRHLAYITWLLEQGIRRFTVVVAQADDDDVVRKVLTTLCAAWPPLDVLRIEFGESGDDSCQCAKVRVVCDTLLAIPAAQYQRMGARGPGQGDCRLCLLPHHLFFMPFAPDTGQCMQCPQNGGGQCWERIALLARHCRMDCAHDLGWWFLRPHSPVRFGMRLALVEREDGATDSSGGGESWQDDSDTDDD